MFFGLPSPTLVTAFWTKEGSGDVYPDVLGLVADATEIAPRLDRGAGRGGLPVTSRSTRRSSTRCTSSTRASARSTPSAGIPAERFMAEGAEYATEVTPEARPARGHDAEPPRHAVPHRRGRLRGHRPRRLPARARFDVFHLEFDEINAPARSSPCATCPTTKWARSGWFRRSGPRSKIPERASPAQRRCRCWISPTSTASACDAMRIRIDGRDGAAGRKVTEQTQAEKLRLVADIARSVWH